MEDPRGKAVHSAQPQLSLSQGFKLKGCRGCPGPLGLSGDPPPPIAPRRPSLRGGALTRERHCCGVCPVAGALGRGLGSGVQRMR